MAVRVQVPPRVLMMTRWDGPLLQGNSLSSQWPVFMFYYSRQLDRFYVGSCKDIKFRVEQHLNKVYPGSFTSKAEDWDLFLVIEELSYSQARKIEKHIKRMKSRVYIENLRRHPEMITKLKTQIL